MRARDRQPAAARRGARAAALRAGTRVTSACARASCGRSGVVLQSSLVADACCSPQREARGGTGGAKSAPIPPPPLPTVAPTRVPTVHSLPPPSPSLLLGATRRSRERADPPQDNRVRESSGVLASRRAQQRAAPPPRTNWTRLVPRPVLTGHAARSNAPPAALARSGASGDAARCSVPSAAPAPAPAPRARALRRLLPHRLRRNGSRVLRGGGAGLLPPPPPPSRTNWTRLVPPPVLIGHDTARASCLQGDPGLGGSEGD